MTGIRWTPEQLAAHKKAVEQRDKDVRAAESRRRWQALGRLPKGTMNKTEAAYAKDLDERKRTGDVIEWRFHPMNIRLGPGVFYEVDFLVLRRDQTVEIHETKGGYTSDKGQMKIRLAAAALPWFRMLKVHQAPGQARRRVEGRGVRGMSAYFVPRDWREDRILTAIVHGTALDLATMPDELDMELEEFLCLAHDIATKIGRSTFLVMDSSLPPAPVVPEVRH